ncbi:MAG: helix-turn-helix transcriptional regulator, partial [Burkholderiaceae bacterium]|nr:helix-turn-helix transcriptional regulator [Burkholderiaceae bacterium]
ACPEWQTRLFGRIEAQRDGARCLGELVRLLLNHDAALGNASRDEFSRAVLALLAQTVTGAAPQPTAAPAPPGGRAAEIQRQRVQRHVLEHLRDPQLSVAGVAEALQLSPRYVHKLFEGQGTSLMRWVLEQRLHACRQDLARRGARTVADIAFDWGFSHPSHFSRAYRRRFGAAPSAPAA